MCRHIDSKSMTHTGTTHTHAHTYTHTHTADVVAATLSSSGKQQFLDHILLEDLAFDTAIIDEAAQTTEPSTLIPLRYVMTRKYTRGTDFNVLSLLYFPLIPLCRYGCRSLVLVGDPRQLPATVLSPRYVRAMILLVFSLKLRVSMKSL